MKHLTWKIGAPISKFQFGFKTIDRKGVLAAERALLVPGGIQDYQLNGFPCPFRFPDAKIFKSLRVYSPNQQQTWNQDGKKFTHFPVYYRSGIQYETRRPRYVPGRRNNSHSGLPAPPGCDKPEPLRPQGRILPVRNPAEHTFPAHRCSCMA